MPCLGHKLNLEEKTFRLEDYIKNETTLHKSRIIRHIIISNTAGNTRKMHPCKPIFANFNACTMKYT